MLLPAPFLADLAEGPEGSGAHWLTADDGRRVRVGHFPSEARRGTVLLFPGRTEYIEKYGRTASELGSRGYDTLAIDWRGQGMADRLLPDRLTGHVHVFDDYQRDVAAMVAAAEALDLPRPWHLIAHSMGGCIGLRAVMNGLPVESVVFSGPMWGIAMSAPTRPAAWAISWGVAALGLGHINTPGTKAASYVLEEPFEGNLLTTDRDMWTYMHRQTRAEAAFQLGGPSLRWLNQALAECRALAALPSPDLPCLTFTGTNDRIVDKSRIADRMARWPGGEMLWIEDGEHECLMLGAQMRADLADRMVALFDAASGNAQAIA